MVGGGEWDRGEDGARGWGLEVRVGIVVGFGRGGWRWGMGSAYIEMRVCAGVRGVGGNGGGRLSVGFAVGPGIGFGVGAEAWGLMLEHGMGVRAGGGGLQGGGGWGGDVTGVTSGLPDPYTETPASQRPPSSPEKEL